MSVDANGMATKRHLTGARALALPAALTLVGCATPPAPQTVYCYRTLADVSCYGQPDTGRESRLVGTYEREPGSAGANAPDDEGVLPGWIASSMELAGRLISPVGSLVGLIVNP